MASQYTRHLPRAVYALSSRATQHCKRMVGSFYNAVLRNHPYTWTVLPANNTTNDDHSSSAPTEAAWLLGSSDAATSGTHVGSSTVQPYALGPCPVWADVLTQNAPSNQNGTTTGSSNSGSTQDESLADKHAWQVERAVARDLVTAVPDWQALTPIPIPMGDHWLPEYITLANVTWAENHAQPDATATSGSEFPLVNGAKVLGVLPKLLLLPSSTQLLPQCLPSHGTDCLPSSVHWADAAGRVLERHGATYLPFFEVASQSDLHVQLEAVVKHGGDVVKEPFDADGTVAIVRDPLQAAFALYQRTDDPTQTKPNTAIAQL
eukprot:m.148982 g.148982  ORF g.148982 m.148982 type:complete len:320 (+) comp17335_c0_seq1:53-1012(+)